jgi:Xaa-Pro aminopeptidase
VAPCFERRAYISGFTGSAGTALVTETEALLWTDGRYYLQAEKELSSDWSLMKSQVPGVPTVLEYLKKHAKPSASISIDPSTFSAIEAQTLESSLMKSGLNVAYSSFNLIDKVWSDRPSLPSAPIRIHDIKYAGSGASGKLAQASAYVKDQGADMMLVCALDEIAWLLNLRGGDIPFNPVFMAYLVVCKANSSCHHLGTLYVDETKIDGKVRDHLHNSKVKIEPYENIKQDLARFADQKHIVCFDGNKVNYDLVRLVAEPLRKELHRSRISDWKAVKNEAEVHGMKKAHIKDGKVLFFF